MPPDSPGWRRFRRTGVVIAERRRVAWTWTTRSGGTLHANPGDWLVRESADGEPWSVRDDIFRSSHQHVDGNRWRRTGTVVARPARAGETVETLEGSVTATRGNWVVRGEAGECWPVPAEEFTRRYAGPID